jgi:two-component system NtrC family sensor kinase
MKALRTVDAAVRLSPELVDVVEQQAATAQILGVIARSPADAQPVFEAIVAAGVRLFPGAALAISRHEDGVVHSLAIAEEDAERAARWRCVFPFPLSPEYIHGAAILERRVVDVADVLETGGRFEAGKRNLAPSGYRAMTVVPLMRDAAALGALAVVRMEPGALSARQIALLQAFADQAVIAIENARLFKETQQALARQTATSEVLRVISGSVTDTQPVFDVIAERAARLTGANSGWVFTFDGEWIRCASSFGLTPQALALALTFFPMRPSGGSYTARAIRDGAVMNFADALAEPDQDYATKPVAKAVGYRSVLSVPMFRGRQVVGAISVNRAEVGRFPDKEVELLQTFASQAVIAIENTRLSNEREARNRELTEALEQQTATSEILHVISRSHTDVQPVFDTIAAAALRLCGASVVNMLTFDGELLHVGALAGLDPDGEAAARAVFPRAPGRDTVGGMAVITAEAFVIEDVLADEQYVFRAGADWGVRSALGIPLLRQGAPIGALAICRPDRGPFSDKLIALLRTFADQAVIAIENVRLFHEIEDKSRQLEAASRHKSAFLANMSHELRTPMNAILGFTRIVLRETRERIDPKQAANLEKILASARHLVGLINATLDLTRIEAGRIEITAGEVAIAPLLDECLRSVEPLLADGVGIDCRVAFDLPPMVVDAGKLRQIVINLLSNAVKFAEQGRIDVRASSRDGRVEIEVADSGIGIPPDKLEAIFEEFEQVDASHTRAHGGTGLGLAIARRLARAMGGELSARSALGVGSTFRLELPLHYRDPHEA